jgi:hypothetical protein
LFPLHSLSLSVSVGTAIPSCIMGSYSHAARLELFRVYFLAPDFYDVVKAQDRVEDREYLYCQLEI